MAKQDQTFLTQFARLLANWNLDDKRIPGMSKEYHAIYQASSPIRFESAVTQIIRDSRFQFFPTVGEFVKYLPDLPVRGGISAEEYAELSAERRANPDAFFGMADVICMMRIAEDRRKRGLQPLSDTAMISAVLETRHICQESSLL